MVLGPDFASFSDAAGGPLSLCLQVAGVESCSGPALGTLPVEHWPAGLLLPHAFVVELPADLPAGTYPLRIDVRDGAVRSLGVDGGAAPVSLGDLQVVAR